MRLRLTHLNDKGYPAHGHADDGIGHADVLVHHEVRGIREERRRQLILRHVDGLLDANGYGNDEVAGQGCREKARSRRSVSACEQSCKDDVVEPFPFLHTNR